MQKPVRKVAPAKRVANAGAIPVAKTGTAKAVLPAASPDLAVVTVEATPVTDNGPE